MDWLYLVYLSSGLFLGWSLGANDAANIFGTAVGTKMVKFRTAAIISSIFVSFSANRSWRSWTVPSRTLEEFVT